MSTEDEILEVLGPGGVARTDRLIAAGVDPSGYHVSAPKVRELILGCQVPRRVRRLALAHLDATVLRGKPATVDCFLLGKAMADLPGDIPREQFSILFDALRDLNKLPIVSAKGQPVS